MEKMLYDMRGKQGNISRLLGFDGEAFVHMLSYRILIFAALIVAVLLAISLAYPVSPGITALQHVGILVIWIFFIPQVFETSKAFAVILSKGVAWGRLNKSYISSLPDSDKNIAKVYAAIPILTIVVWIAAFACACVVFI